MLTLKSNSRTTHVLSEKVDQSDMLQQLSQAAQTSLLLLTFGLADFHVQFLLSPFWVCVQTVPQHMK